MDVIQSLPFNRVFMCEEFSDLEAVFVDLCVSVSSGCKCQILLWSVVTDQTGANPEALVTITHTGG